ncbi:MAG: carboxypeptidase-like regulatory domain-containing protein, partial [Chitinophagales bacterium]|nr:carboxypeptidase-like regulatory domain-containing protein [Chitinophagales bacterium]MDW8419473.1 carboxypeptidase-like regulatory domain-containing protein [Chitinophagales bacterium]
MKQPLLLAAIFFSGVFLRAQTITGVLFDKNTGEPLVGATVAVKGTATGTATDIDGKFSLKITQSPPFTLSFSYVGYET